MKSITFAVLLLTTLLIAGPVLGDAGVWTEARHDSGNSGYAPGTGDMGKDIIEKWNYSGVSFLNHVLVADLDGDGENEVVTSTPNQIDVLNGETGDIEWSCEIPRGSDDSYPHPISLVKIGDKYDILVGWGAPEMMLEYGKDSPIWETDLAMGPDSDDFRFLWVGTAYSGDEAYGVVVLKDKYDGYPRFSPPLSDAGNSEIAVFDMRTGEAVWNATVPVFAASSAVADLDADGSDEIVVAGLGPKGGEDIIKVFSTYGIEEWNVSCDFTGDDMYVGTVYIGDIAGDGSPEIVIGNLTGFSAFDNRGNLLWHSEIYGYAPYGNERYAMDWGAVVPGKGFVCVVPSTGDFYMIDGSGDVRKGNIDGAEFTAIPVSADMNGDGSVETLLTYNNVDGNTGDIAFIEFGDLQPDRICSREGPMGSYIGVADVDSDGDIEILCTVEGQPNYLVVVDGYETVMEEVPLYSPMAFGAVLILVVTVFYVKRRFGEN